MKIFLDVDGVILNLEKSFTSYTSYKSGKPAKKISDGEWHQLWNDFLSDETAGELAPLIDVSQIELLSTYNEIILITGFPIAYKEKRIRNLKNINLQYNEIYFVPNICASEKLDVINNIASHDEEILFIDDNQLNCMSVKINRKNSIVFEATNSIRTNKNGIISASPKNIFEKILPSILEQRPHVF